MTSTVLMGAADYRESLRAYSPRVFVDGRAVGSVADEPVLAPGINAIGVTYDYALAPEHAVVMTATTPTGAHRQPDAARRPHHRRPAGQAGGRPAGLPGVRLRPALPLPRRARRHRTGHRTRRRDPRHRLRAALRGVPAPRRGRRPHPRRRHDRRRG